jgi:hypothetical protein
VAHRPHAHGFAVSDVLALGFGDCPRHAIQWRQRTTVPNGLQKEVSSGVWFGGTTMSDNTSLKGVQDRTRINLSEDYEVCYWCEKFGVTADELRAAVKRVGNSAKAVENEINGQWACEKP